MWNWKWFERISVEWYVLLFEMSIHHYVETKTNRNKYISQSIIFQLKLISFSWGHVRSRLWNKLKTKSELLVGREGVRLYKSARRSRVTQNCHMVTIIVLWYNENLHSTVVYWDFQKRYNAYFDMLATKTDMLDEIDQQSWRN